MVRMRNAQYDCANATGFIGHLSGTRRCDLNSIEMAAIGKAIYVLAKFRIDSDIDQSRLNLRGLVRRNAIEARCHRIPVPTKIGVHCPASAPMAQI